MKQQQSNTFHLNIQILFHILLLLTAYYLIRIHYHFLFIPIKSNNSNLKRHSPAKYSYPAQHCNCYCLLLSLNYTHFKFANKEYWDATKSEMLFTISLLANSDDTERERKVVCVCVCEAHRISHRIETLHLNNNETEQSSITVTNVESRDLLP